MMLISFLIASVTQAQQTTLNQTEALLQRYFVQLYSSSNDQKRAEINDSICTTFQRTLSNPLSYDFPFDSLQYVGKIYSTDQEIRIYSWNYIQSTGNNVFTCFIQQKSDHSVYSLIQKKKVFLPAETGVIDKNNWYGALYYSAIPFMEHKKSAYFLLGWSQLSPKINFKVIEVLSFQNGKIMLGAPVIFKNGQTLDRIVIPYDARYSLSLAYDPKLRMILFNHLNNVNGLAIPDENFSGFQLTKTGLKLTKEMELKDRSLPHMRPRVTILDHVD
ncbi:MAG: hypothetical protein ACP5F6_03115 [Microbacter sp.]